MALARRKALKPKVSTFTLPTLVQTLTVPEGETPSCEYGNAVHISTDGYVLVVAAIELNQVEIYVPKAGTWDLVQVLVPENGVGFGISVATSGDGSLIAVGAHAEQDTPGAVYLYRRSAGIWRPEATVHPESSTPGDRFGSSLALSLDGEVLAVGAPGADTAYVFTGGSDIVEWPIAALDVESGTEFGFSVSLDAAGGVLAIGHPGFTTELLESAGRVLVFTNTSQDWASAPSSILFADESDDAGEPDRRDDRFGSNVLLNGPANRLAVGAVGVSHSRGPDWGAVYCFQLSDELWVALGPRMIPGNTEPYAHMGDALAFDDEGDVLLIGSYGESRSNVNYEYGFIYEFLWRDQAKTAVAGLEAYGHYGRSLSMSADGRLVAIGATGAILRSSGTPVPSKVYLYGEPEEPEEPGGPEEGEGDPSPTGGVPGVYAIESNDPLLSIPAGATAIPVFIGVFRDQQADLLSNASCIEVSSFTDFNRRFGASQSTLVTLAANGSIAIEHTAARGSRALQLYFDNGGGSCFILPIKNPADATELMAIPAKIRRFPQITLFVCTEDDGNQQALYSALDPLLRNVGDGFLIADSVDGVTVPTTTAQRTAVYSPALSTAYSGRSADRDVTVLGHTFIGAPPAEGARITLDLIKADDKATYIRINKALDDWHQANYPNVKLLASAAVAGVYCRTDAQRGVWKAPGGMQLNNVRGLVQPADFKPLELMEHNINRIRFSANEGAQVWGARTLEDPETPLWLHINVSRLFDAAARDIRRAMQFAVFLPNNASTWTAVGAAIRNYLDKLWRDGGLLGATAEEAYYVQIGRGLTMSDDDILEGRMIVHVGMAALRPVEFIEVVFSQMLATA